MPRKTPAPRQSRRTNLKDRSHRHFRPTWHRNHHVDIVTLALIVFCVFVELLVMTSVPLGVSLYEFRSRDVETYEAQIPVRSNRTYERWYRDEIASIVPASFFALRPATPDTLSETQRIHDELLEMRVPKFLQDVHLGLVILASRKLALLSGLQGGGTEVELEILRADLAAFQDRYEWLKK